MSQETDCIRASEASSDQHVDLRQCPLDPCLFVLAGKNGYVHGVIRMHVDDGLCGGDDHFLKVLDQLEQPFPFDSKRNRNFTFTGIHIQQDDDFNAHLGQTPYVQNIEPIKIERHQRKQEQDDVNEGERQQLRGIIGSLQYAATNTRPDVSARLAFYNRRLIAQRFRVCWTPTSFLGMPKSKVMFG